MNDIQERKSLAKSPWEGGRDEAEVRPQSEGEGGRVEGSRERTSCQVWQTQGECISKIILFINY